MNQILVVDDHPDQLEMLAATLYYNGFTVLRAGTGMQAINIAKEQRPDLILMDVKLPDMNGMLAAEIIHARDGLEHIPIIGVTALDLPLQLARDRGLVELLFKPVPPARLVQTVRRYLPPPSSESN